MIRRLLRRLFPRGGGSIPVYRPAADEDVVLLSPGWVEVSPEVDERYAAEFLKQMNQRRP